MRAGKKYFTLMSFLVFIFIPALSNAESSLDNVTYEVNRTGEKETKDLQKPRQPSAAEQMPELQQQVSATGETKFFVKKVELAGCESFPADDFLPILSKYSNREVTMNELNDLSSNLEREYLKKGIIAAVFVPPQDVKSEIVTIQVVEAKMGELEIQEHKYFDNNRLRYYWNIKPGEILSYKKIGTALQVMSRNPDREVKSILRAGEKTGTTNVVLSAKTNFPIHLFNTFDNDGITSSGKSRISNGVRHNNFLGADDTFLAGYSQGTHFRGKYFYHSVPISPDNIFLTYGYSDSHSVPKKEYTNLKIDSNALTASTSLRKEFYSADAYIGDMFFGFDAKDKDIGSYQGVINKDRLRVINIGGSYNYRGAGSNTIFSSQLSQGLYAFGASPKKNPLSSRQGQAHASFTKANFELNHVRSLPYDLKATFRYRQQTAFDILSPQEEVNLGGIDSVRGYPAADFLADNASVCNLELISQAFFIPDSWHLPYAETNLKNETSLVCFMDYGYGNRRGMLYNNERRKVNFMSVGAGLRFKCFNQVFLRLEWAVNVGDRPITETGKSQFHFAFSFQEQLPEEIARMKRLAEENKKFAQ